MHLQNTNRLTSYIVSAIMLLSFLGVSLAFAPTAHAAVSSEDLKDTINAKCNFAMDRYKGNKSGSNYKDFEDACKGSGDYALNTANLEERAKRLLVICGHKGVLKTSSYDAYNNRGATGYRDCDNVKSNDELKKLASKAFPGAKNLRKVNDPALKCASDSHDDEAECDLIKKYINPIIAFLTAFVGIAVTIGIISGGIRYAAAGDDPQKVSAAKLHIRGALISLLVFIFLYAAIQWMIPAV